jgi:hypothetical protein
MLNINNKIIDAIHHAGLQINRELQSKLSDVIDQRWRAEVIHHDLERAIESTMDRRETE